jgi:hypothetical protein
VGGLQVAQAAVLHERDGAAGELELEQRRVVRRAHQHRLPLQLDARLARGQDAVGDGVGLARLVAHDTSSGRAPSGARRRVRG